MKNTKYFGVLLVVLLSGFIFGSCEIGLGAAVDTEAPSITIESPGIDVVIRDSFALKGSWSDDGDVAEINAKLERTDGTGTPFNFPGEFVIEEETNRRSGSWKVIINPKEQGILDGTYQASISIKDKGEHVTTQTRTFTIDNTPPLIVLQRPASKVDSESVDSYGQSFTLTGQAADDNNVKLIRINFYSDPECKNFLHSVERKNVPPTIDLDVAQFKEGEENDYFRIYQSSTKEGTKQFYCSIEAYDEAIRYPIDGTHNEDDEQGNRTDIYYLYDELVTEILSEYKITQVYHMQNGTFTDENDASRSADISNVIMSKLAAKEIKKGSFSLNPENNPVFTVSGKSELTGRVTDFVDSEYSITNGSSLQFEITPGLDNFPIKADTVKIYVIECDNSQNPIDGAEKIYLTTGTPTKSGSTLKYMATLSSKLIPIVVGHNYLFGIEGEDEKLNPIFAKGKGYGFHLSSSGAAPEVIITSPEKQFYKGGEDVLVEGSVLIAEGIPLFTIYNNEEIVYTTDFANVTPEQQGSKNKYNFRYTIPAQKFVTTNAQGTQISAKFEIKAAATYEGIVGSKTSTIVYDVENPTLEITSHDVNTSYNGSASFSGSSVMFSGTATDPSKTLGCSISSIKYAFKTVDQTPTDAEWKSMSSIGDWYLPANLKVDNNSPEGALEEGQYYLFMKGIDLAGNESSLVRLAFYVDQFSPEFSVNGLAINQTNYFNTVQRDFNITSTETGLDYTVTILEDGAETPATLNPVIPGTLNYTIFASGLISQKEYTLTIKAKDIAEKTTVKSYKVMKDDIAPTISITYPTQNAGISSNSIEIKAKVFDKENETAVNTGSGVKKVWYKLYRRNETEPTEWSASLAGTINGEEWKQIMSVDSSTEGFLVLKVEIEDNIGNRTTTENKVEFSVDSGAPGLKINTVTSPVNHNFTISGKAIDSNEIAKVEVYDDVSQNPIYTKTFTDEDKALIKTAYTEAKAELGDGFAPTAYTEKAFEKLAADNWSVDINVADYTSASHRFTVKATDVVNSVTSNNDTIVIIDKDAPTVGEIPIPSKESTELSEFEIMGSATDVLSNIVEIEIQFSNDNVTWMTPETINILPASQAKTSIWNYKLKFAEKFTYSGKKYVRAKAKDAAGNWSDYTSTSFDYDTRKPTITVNNYAYNNGSSYEDKTDGTSEIVEFASSKEFGISGTFDDDWDLAESNPITIKQGNLDITGVTFNSTTKTWKIEGLPRSSINATSLETGSYVYTIKVTDKSGKYIEKTVTAKVDISAPTVTITNPSYNLEATSTDAISGSSKKFEGTIADEGAGQVGVASYSYAFTQSATAPIEASAWTTVNSNGGSWEITKDLVSGTSPVSGKLTEGQWYLHVKGKDKADNETATPVTRSFYVDLASPTVTANTGITTGTNCKLQDNKYFFNSAVTLVVEGNDTYGLPTTAPYTIKIDSTPLTGVTPVKNENKYTYTIPVAKFAENTDQTINITVTDKVGKTATKSFDVYYDNAAPTVGISSPTENSPQDQQTIPVTFTLAETGVGIKTQSTSATADSDLEYSLDNSTWVPTQYPGGNNYNMNIDIGSTEGEKHIYAKAKDKLGNESIVFDRKFNYDKAYPTGAITAYKINGGTSVPLTESSFSTKAKFSLNGTSNDSNAVQRVEVYQKIGDEAEKLIAVKVGNETTWEVESLPRAATENITSTAATAGLTGTAAVQSGSYQYTVKVVDVVNKTTTLNIVTATIDTTAPTVEITNPETNKGATKDDALSGSSYNFSGKVNDNTGGVGVASYSYAFTQTVAAPTDASKWTTVNSVGGNWSISKDLVSGTTNVDGKLCEGQWYLHVKGKDKADNESTTVTRSFYVDLSNPTVSNTTAITTGANCILQSSNYFFNSELILVVEGSDTYGLPENPYTITIDTDELTDVIPVKEGNKYTYSIPVDKFTADTYQTLTVTVIDKVGKTTNTTYNIFYDPTAPVVDITRPESGSNQDQTAIQAVFTVEENGIGVNPATTTGTGASAVTNADSDLEFSTDNANWTQTKYTGGARFNQPITLTGGEGQKTLYVRATDKLGNVSETKSVSFYYDRFDPVITSTEPSSYAKAGESFTLTGTSYDTNELSFIEVKDSTASQTYKTTDASSRISITKAGTPVAISSATDTSPITWAITFTPADNLTEGNHNFKIRAYDVAGRLSDEITESVFVDRTAPTLNDDTNLIMPNVTQTENGSFKFEGTAKDDTNASKDSKVKEVLLQFANETATGPAATGWVTAVGSTNWNSTITFSEYTTVFNTEGSKKVFIKAVDYAGNESEIVTKTFDYDKSSPTSVITSYTPNGSSAVSITSGVTTFSTKDKFALGVTAGDTNAIKRIEVYQGTQLIAVKVVNNTSIDVNNTSIDVPNLPRAITEKITNVTVDGGLNTATTTAEVNTGSYVYKVKVYDAVNKVTDSSTITINIDKTAPEFTILTPTEGGSKGTGAINSTSYKFSGSANDGEDPSSTGVGKVWYQILPSTSQEPEAPTANFTVDSSWTNKGFTAANGTDSWNFFGAFKAKGTTGTEFEEGTYKVYVCAVDNAGNCADIQSVEFDVDMKDPKVTTTWGDNSEFNSSTTQIKTGSYTIKYKVEETNGYASGSPLLTVKKDDVAIGKTISTTTPYYTESTADANGYKTVTVVIPTNVNGDGLYEYTIYAKDVVGKETSITRNVRLDTKPPVLTVISPTLSEYQNSEKVKINGSSEDDSGTLAVWYAYDPSTAPTAPETNTTVDATWKAAGWTKANGTTNWKITGDVTNGVDSGNGDGILGVEGSAKTIYIAAVDKNGLVSTHAPETVMVDKTPPTVVTETTDMFTNTTFTLKGDVFDANGISSVSISDGTYTYTPTVSSGSYANAKNATSKATWTQSFTITEGRNGSKSGELSDGNYTFTITTTDIAGKTTVNTRSIKIDTVAPVISSKTITFTDNPAVASGVAHNVNKADLEVTVSDDNLDQVYYYVKDDSDTTIIKAEDVDEGLWNAIIPTTSNGVTSYKKKLSFSDGTGKIYLKVTDKASNETTDITLPYAVDTKAPEAPTLVSVDGAPLTGNKLVNGKKDVKFKVTVKDQNNVAKVASVNLSAVGTIPATPTDTASGKGTKTDATTGEWEITVPSSLFSSLSSGTLAIKVKATDVSGNAEEYTVFSVALDNTKPKSEIKIPASSTINGTLDITGTVTEINPKSVSLYYSTAATAPTASPTENSSGWTLVTGTTKTVGTAGVTASDINNFTFSSIDVNTLSGASLATNKQHVLHLLAFATDEAGNECEIGNSSTVKSVKTYTVDMDADRPVIKFSNIKLGTSMSSTSRTGFENNELYGSVTDDDGIPEICYYIGDSCPDEDSTSWISPDDNNSDLIYASGSFTLKFPQDGEKTIFFKVTDSSNKVFLSSTSTTYDVDTIKVTDSESNKYGYRPSSGTTTNSSVVYIKVDTNPPSVAEAGYTVKATPDIGDTDWSTEITSALFGGTNNKLYIRQYAYDTNGVSKVVLHIPYDSADSGVSGFTNTTTYTTDGYYEYNLTKPTTGTKTKKFNEVTYDKYVSSQINVKGMNSGTRQWEIIASDGIKTQTTPINVSVDNNAPGVKVQSQAENEQLRAGFLMKGIFNDGD